MKKITMIAAALAVCTFSACAAEVLSDNIVGYYKLTLQPGFNLVGAQFVPVGTASIDDITEVLIASELPGVDPNGAGTGFARLQTWNSGTYANYQWAGTTLASPDGWDWPETENKWMTVSSEDIADISVQKDQGFWLWLDDSVTPKTVTFKGEVYEGASAITNNLVSGFNLVANPWPQSIDIQSFTLENLPGVDPNGNGTGYVRLQVWNSGTYANYEWAGTTLASPDGWDWPETENKWMTVSSEDIAANITLNIGEGFWLWLDPSQSYTDPKIIFTKPDVK